MASLKNFALILIIAAIVYAVPLPDNLNKCNRNKRTEFSHCIKEAIQDALVKLKDGNRKIGAIPLEPLTIEGITIDQGKPSNPINLQLTFNNLKMFGISNTKILDVNDTIVDNVDYFYINAVIPEIIFKADYKVTGQVLLLPITGEGPCTIWIKNMGTKHYMEGVEYEKKGKTHLKYGKYKLEFYPEGIKYDLQNLFNGDKRLGDNMNKVFNDNAKEIFSEVKEPFEHAFSLLFQSMVNKVFERVSMQDMYLF